MLFLNELRDSREDARKFAELPICIHNRVHLGAAFAQVSLRHEGLAAKVGLMAHIAIHLDRLSIKFIRREA